MIVTKVRRVFGVSIDDGYPTPWVGSICGALIDGEPGVVITIDGIEPANLHNWSNVDFRLIVTK